MDDITITTFAWEHRKRGGFYQILTYCVIEATMTPAVVYMNMETKITWCRPCEEFFDGRFVQRELSADFAKGLLSEDDGA